MEEWCREGGSSNIGKGEGEERRKGGTGVVMKKRMRGGEMEGLGEGEMEEEER